VSLPNSSSNFSGSICQQDMTKTRAVRSQSCICRTVATSFFTRSFYGPRLGAEGQIGLRRRSSSPITSHRDPRSFMIGGVMKFHSMRSRQSRSKTSRTTSSPVLDDASKPERSIRNRMQLLWNVILSIIGSGLGTTAVGFLFKRKFDTELEIQKAFLTRASHPHARVPRP
jgi:hypothetical protein